MVTIQVTTTKLKDRIWVTHDSRLLVLHKLAKLLATPEGGLLRLKQETTGFEPVDEVGCIDIVIEPNDPKALINLSRAEPGGCVAVRFKADTDYYTFDQLCKLFEYQPAIGEPDEAAS